MVKYLALASSMSKDGKTSISRAIYVQPIILKLLVVWLFDCPNAVQSFLDSRPHLTYLLELISNENATVSVRGLAAVLLGLCIICNKAIESGKSAFSIVDAISQRVGFTSYLLRFDEMQKSFLFTSAKPALARKPLTRSTAASMSEINDVDENENSDQKNGDHPMLAMLLDSQFVFFLKGLEEKIREQIVEIYSHPKSQVVVVPADLEQNSGEDDKEYIKRLKKFVEKQCLEIQVFFHCGLSLCSQFERVVSLLYMSLQLTNI